MEAMLCANFEEKIKILKKQLAEKQIIFHKLSQELFRMLGLFERLEKMGESHTKEVVEAETMVRTRTVLSITDFQTSPNFNSISQMCRREENQYVKDLRKLT